MSSIALQTALPPGPTASCSPAEALALAQRRLSELDRLRGIGMEQAETLSRHTRSLDATPDANLRAMIGAKGTIREFERINRAVRQIVVLEFEIRGLFKAPDREGIRKPKLGERREDLLSDLRDNDDYRDLFDDTRDINDLNDLRVRMDYSRDPIGQIVADIRGALGILPPADDPFAPPTERPEPKPMSHEMAKLERAAETLRRLVAAKRPPGMVARSAEPAAKPAPAKAAKPARPRKGFRVPPTSPHNPNTAPGAKRKRSRGPPRKRR